ncbi:DnaJ domain-containing protein [Hymenobacter sp. ASUV-10]|uniref:DnaJ domain-containing protein n=1 Tax=Hymenobacter aranciens TaxID=3063996 RepID=A0ABT9B9F4_9BACT|nr:DnaJ domain-containing protein [Hymenobacter sp. ASUV-10]MDO7873178.1 DnaJ domain-containing protein [Hymenobacter sp. ASUV-10]
MSQNHYQILGVAATAPAAEIKRAYRQLVVRYHPDKHGGDTRYEDQFKAVSVAYGILSDPGRRASYDFQLAQAARRAEEQRRQQQHQQQQRPVNQHVYGVPMPPPTAPLRTRPPAGRRERHYVPRQPVRFNRRDWLLTLLVLAGLLGFGFGTKAALDRYSAYKAYRQGLAAYARREVGIAASLMEETLYFRPGYGPAIRRRAELAVLAGREPTAAKADFEALLRENPSRRDAADMHYRLGRCELALGRPAAAAQQFSRAIVLDSTLSLAYLARGRVRLYDLKQKPQALHDLEQGLRQYQQRGRRPPLRYVQARGSARAALSYYAAARADYLEVMAADPLNDQVRYLMGCLARQTGDRAMACEFLTQAALLGNTYAEAEQATVCP